MLAKDIMTTEVITVAPATPVYEIAEMLLTNCISAVPVVEGTNSVIGIVSEGDLMRRPEANTGRRKRSWWLQAWKGSTELAQEYSKSHGLHASDVMTRDVVTVDEATPVAEIAESLERKRIKRVPVLQDGRLVGIVSRADLIRALATRKTEPLPPVSKDDQTFRENVLAELRKEPWANLAFINATVEKGVVHLWGLAESPEQRSAYEIAAQGVPGVKSVQNHLSDRFPDFYWAE